VPADARERVTTAADSKLVLEDLSVKSALIVQGRLHSGRLDAAKLVDRSPPEVAVLGRESYLGAAGEPAPEDANLRLELAVVVPPG
jgi:hypothetical protein